MHCFLADRIGLYLHVVAMAGPPDEECWFQVVKVRGESMAAAARMGRPHGMVSIIGLSDADLETICKDVRNRLGADTICQLANFLFPQVLRYPAHAACNHMHVLEFISSMSSQTKYA